MCTARRRTGGRARIFEIRSRSSSTPSGVSDLSGHSGTVAAAPWTANGLFWRFIASWAFSCKTATCVIDAGHVQTSHVLGSLHIDLVMHDTFTCTLALALARRLHSGQQE